MKYPIPATLLCCVAILMLFPRTPTLAQRQDDVLPVIPAPAEAAVRPGNCVITSTTPILAPSALQPAAAALAVLLGSEPPAEPAPFSGPAIRFEHDPAMPEEAYELETFEEGVRIRAGSDVGAFYAVQALRQLLPACLDGGSRFAAWRLPVVSVHDHPRFPWRGVMLDCSRHFLPASEVRRIIDRMAMLRMNRLHWHLTDDQGWRIDIRAYPELTRVGAWRGEGAGRYGGFYSQEEIRDVVAYARDRHVTVVPEIDIPAHSTAAIASYPWLSCTGDSVTVATDFGATRHAFCPGRESTYRFLESVIGETAELFPGSAIHVGGDECPTYAWSSCDSCRAAVTRNGLAGVGGLWSYFFLRVHDMVKQKGAEMAGWEEVTGAAPRETVVQAWNSMENAVAAAASGHRVICSPIEPLYLNYHDWYNTLADVYAFEPIAGRAWPRGGEEVLGIEACLWTESLSDAAQADRYLFPRIAAVAEAAWTLADRKDWDSFRARLGMLGGRWTRQGQEYSAVEGVDWDDGLPLTVRASSPFVPGISRIDLSAPAQGMPALLSTAAGFDPWSLTPQVLHQDSMGMLVEYGRTTPAAIGGYALRGLFKRGNPWSELSDSTALDGLYHLPADRTSALPLGMTCYPNPLRTASGAARVSVRVMLPEPGALDIEVFDTVGRIVHAERHSFLYFGSSTLTFSIGSLPPGTYLLRARSGGAVATQKFLLLR